MATRRKTKGTYRANQEPHRMANRDGMARETRETRDTKETRLALRAPDNHRKKGLSRQNRQRNRQPTPAVRDMES